VTYYKAVNLERYSHYDGKTQWRAGSIIRPDKVDPPEAGPCGHGLHVSPLLIDAVGYQTAPSRYYEVGPVGIIAGDDTKVRCSMVRVIREIGRAEQDELAGFKLYEANHPVNPFLLRPRKFTPTDKNNLCKWASVWDSVGDSVRASVWASVWASVRDSVGVSVWFSVRDSVGASVWASVGDSVRASVWASVWAGVGDSVGDSVWASVGDSVGVSVGASVWVYVGSFFDLQYTVDISSAVTLWEQGFVPSFDGTTWRLHAGKDARVVYEMECE
jgi:hypothetical protein